MMRSGFVRVLPPLMADPEPPPEPTPFPIRIIADPPPPPSIVGAAGGGPESPLPEGAIPAPGKRADNFYQAWDKFLALEPKRAKKTSLSARKVETQKRDVQASGTGGDGLHVKENATASWEQAASACRRKVSAIVAECTRLNQKYRDAAFDLETNPYCLQSLNGRYPKAVDKLDPPPWIKRVEDIFDSPQFFIDGATPTDVHQGSGGDCWFLAALMAVSAHKQLIDRLCVARDEKVGVYGFVFYRDGAWEPEVIDDKLFLNVGDDDDLCVVRGWDKEKREGLGVRHPDEDALRATLQRGGEALYFSHCKSSETWLPLIEKAYAKAHGDYFSIEGGFASEGIEDLTGGVGVVLNPEDIMDKERFWREQLSLVNKKYLFGGGSQPTSTKGFIGGHAYAVLRAWEEGDLKLLKLRNPWGEVEWEGDWSDGSKLWTAEMMTKLNHTFGDDGVFWISYKDFLKHFPSINRVRLFSGAWQVSQQWTCVNVPWTIDYLDTKFQFSVSKPGPVVLVLSQPDDRYFYGLRGRFLFALHFRVYRAGGAAEGEAEGEEIAEAEAEADPDDPEPPYLVRSMHNSGNETVFTRSVSAELDLLAPGTYNVIFKITATRSPVAATAAESIRKFALERKDKLLSVGRRFDYAQAKGNLRALEKANGKRVEASRRARHKREWKRARKVRRKEKERAARRKKRAEEAMRVKRKVYEGKRREKRLKRRAKAAAAAGKGGGSGRCEERGEEVRVQAGSGVGDERSASTVDEVGNVLTPASEGVGESSQDVVGVEDGKITLHTPEAEGKEGRANLTDRKPEPSTPLQTNLREQPETEPVDRWRSSHSRPGRETSQNAYVHRRSRSNERGEEDFDLTSFSSGSPLLPPSEVDDDDFDWDSDIDGPAFSTSSGAPSDFESGSDTPSLTHFPAPQQNDPHHNHQQRQASGSGPAVLDSKDSRRQRSSRRSRRSSGSSSSGGSDDSARNEIFAADPWNATCVLGLRVYAESCAAKVWVVKGKGDGI